MSKSEKSTIMLQTVLKIQPAEDSGIADEKRELMEKSQCSQLSLFVEAIGASKKLKNAEAVKVYDTALKYIMRESTFWVQNEERERKARESTDLDN